MTATEMLERVRKLPRFGLCRIGWHFPVTVDETLFVDRVNRREVFGGRCRCGKRWMHQSVFGLPFSKVERTSVAAAEEASRG